MGERIAGIILLVEDLNQANLLRRYLKRLGQGSMRLKMLPRGQGSGEQDVRERYAAEVRATRTQMTKTKACLIAMIDADIKPIENRRQQLDRALRDADEEPRSPSEPILNLIPKRNVETWILCLNSETVDEITDYRHDPRVNAKSIKDAANALYSWTRPKAAVPVNCVPSLQDCVPEFERIPK